MAEFAATIEMPAFELTVGDLPTLEEAARQYATLRQVILPTESGEELRVEVEVEAPDLWDARDVLAEVTETLYNNTGVTAQVVGKPRKVKGSR